MHPTTRWRNWRNTPGRTGSHFGHFGAPLIPTKVTLAYAKGAGFEWGSDAAFDMLDCNSLASGDADVINTTLQLILPCLDDVKVLASVTGEGISLTPDSPTVGEVNPDLALALWNGHSSTRTRLRTFGTRSSPWRNGP